MSGVRTFFRHCPSCGRRFEIRLVSKKSLESESLTETEPKGDLSAPSLLARPVTLTEEAPVIVDIDEFQYTYECKHCGHEWSEIHKTKREASKPKGYTGD
jgi:uncharacterized Zn finger protein